MNSSILKFVLIFGIVFIFTIIFFVLIFFCFCSTKSGNFKYMIKKAFSDTNIDINYNIFTLVIGTNQDKHNLSKYIVLDHAFKKVKVTNTTSEYQNILSFEFVKVNSVILVLPIIQDFLNVQDKCQVYIEIIEIFTDIFNTTRCFNSIILQINHTHLQQLESIYDLQSYIKCICENVQLNIPIYLDFHLLNIIKHSEIFVSNIAKKHCLQMIGYQNQQYNFDSFNLKSIYNNMDILLNKITNIVYQIIFVCNNNNISLKLMLFIKELKKFLYQISDYAYQISKIMTRKYQPVFRGFIITGFFIINKDEGYVFISDLINYKLIGEENLVDLSKNYTVQGRNKIYEILLTFFFIISTTYLIYCGKTYITNSQKCLNLSSELFANINMCNIKQVDRVVKIVHEINKINNKVFTINIIDLIEIYIFNRKHQIDLVNQKMFYLIYQIIYSEIKLNINNYINFYKDQINYIISGKIDVYLKTIGNKYKELHDLTKLHNNIKDSDDIHNELIKFLIILNDSSNAIQQDTLQKLYEIKNFTINIKYIDNFKNVYLSDETVIYSVQQIILKIKEYVDNQNYIQKLQQMYDKIIVIVNSVNIDNKINVLDRLIELYDDIKQTNLKEVLQYQLCLDTLNYLKSIDYITNEVLIKIKKDLIISSEKFILEVKEIKHDIIGALIDVQNFKIADYVDILINDLKILYSSDICKRYLLTRTHRLSEKVNQLICIPENIVLLQAILEEYDEVKEMLSNKKVLHITLNMLDKLLFKNIEHVILQDFNYFSIQNNSQNFIFKKIMENYNKFDDIYVSIIDNVVLKNNEPAKEFLRKIFENYINIIYNEIINLNIFQENSNIVCGGQNYIVAAYQVDTKEDLVLKIKDSLHKLIKITKLIKQLITVLNVNKKYILYTKDLEKLAFIVSTIEIVEDYKEDNDNNKISILIQEIIHLFNTSSSIIIKSRRDMSDNNYISYAYTKIINKFKRYITDKQKYDLKQLVYILKSNSSYRTYPFIKAEDASCVAEIEELEEFYSAITKIINIHNNVGRSNFNKEINNLLVVLNEYSDIYKNLVSSQEVNISIILDKLLNSVTKVTILKEEGDHKEIVALEDEKSVVFSFINQSKFILTIPEIPIPGFKYNNMYTKYLKVKNNIVFTIPENFLIHISYLNQIIGSRDKNNLYINFEVPITFESINAKRNSVNTEHAITNSVLIITVHNNIIKNIEKLSDLINQFQYLSSQLSYDNIN